MLVLWDRLLIALGCNTEMVKAPFPCPMHPHTAPSLGVITDSGVSTFSCTVCKFNGDAISLVTKARGLKSLAEAMQLFLPGNELSHTLQSALSETQLQAYLNGQHSQVLIREYIRRCHDALSTVMGQRLITELSRNRCNYRKIPDTLGVLCTDKSPPGLHKLEQSVYKGDIFSIYAYEYDNTITAITIRGTNTGLVETIPLVAADKGIYPEGNLPANPEYLIVAQDEELTTELYARGEYHTATGFPVVALRGYPLPNKYHTLQHIYLLSTGNSPLTLANAVKAFAASTIIAGTTYNPAISVLATDNPTIDPVMLVHISSNAIRIEQWIAQELFQQYRQYGMSAIYRLLQGLPSFGNRVSIITTLLQQMEAPAELMACVDKHRAVYNKRVILSSYVCVYLTPTGYLAANDTMHDPAHQLSNFTFTITQILYQTTPFQIIYRAVIKPTSGPVLTVLLRDADFRTGTFLRHAIVAGYMQAGLPPPHILCSDRRDISWREIRDMFNDNLPDPVTAIETIGISPQLTLELPHLVITEHGAKIDLQTKVLKSDTGMALYSGIRPFKWRHDDLDPCVKLWQTPTVSAAAMTACLSHLILCVIANLAYRKVARSMPRHHLLFTDTLMATWRPVLKQFIQVISNSTQLPISQGGVMRWLAQYASLGDLPLPLELPDRYYKVSAHHILGLTPRNWLANVGTDFATTVNSHDNVTYFSLPNRALSRDILLLPVADIMDLQAILPELLQCVINQTWDIPVEEYAASANPIMDTYKLVGNMLGVTTPDILSTLMHTAYTVPPPVLIEMPRPRRRLAVRTG